MSDLRSRTIRLAHTNPVLRPYLLNLLTTDRVAMEFDTQDALDEYLKNHPQADKSKHTVKKQDEGASEKQDEGASEKQDEGASEKQDEGASEEKPPSASFGSKLKEHVTHVVFDDISEAWDESKKAYADIVRAVASKTRSSKRNGILTEFKSTNKATKTFFSNRRYRRKKMKAFSKSIKDGAKAIGNRVFHAIKAEVKEAWDGVKALGQVLTPGSPPLEKKQKKALYSLGAYVAGASLTAAGGGILMAGAAVAKSFSLHVGIKAISHLADSFFVHYEWGVEGSHIVHGVTHAMSHIASKKDDEASEALVEAMVLAVSKVLDTDMSDEDVERMMAGEDDDAYDDGEDIPAIDKLKSKADKESKKSGNADKSEKTNKKASLRDQVIRLAHARPEFRAHLLPILKR